MPTYATPAELAEYIGASEPGAHFAARLRSASRLVARAATARYDVDAEQLARDAGKRTAMHEATLEQAAAWVGAGIDPTLGTAQLTRTVKSKSLSGGAGGASVTYDDDPGAVHRVMLAQGDELVPAALAILVDAGLVSTAIASVDPARDVYLVGPTYDITTGRLDT